VTATIVRTDTSRWLPYPVTDGGVRLYCLPHAGGTASAFRRWIGRLDGVTVCPLQPPGRETRSREQPHRRMDELVRKLVDVVLTDACEGPWAVYGHSLGALVGFELIKEVRRHGGPPPVHFVVSGCSAPQWIPADHAVRASEMSDAELVDLLRNLGGTPESLLANPRLLRTIMRPLREDLAVKDSYRYEPLPPLEVPITAIIGTDDWRADAESMRPWREQTVRRFESYALRRGHFAVLEQTDTTLRLIGHALRPWSHPTH
jgi:medium-chain acyl-[acyl-carrier-protein] hydrolase